MMATKKWIALVYVGSIMIGCAPTLRENRYKKTDEKPLPVNLPLRTIPSDEVFFKIARRYIGIPYKYGGTNRRGVDCSGFVALFYKEVFGIVLPHTTKKMVRSGRWIPYHKLRAGDLVFFKTKFWGRIDHVGIYVSDKNFIHASTNRGVIFSNIEEEYYKKRFKEAKRIIK